MAPTNAQIADVIDGAYDQLLTRGRSGLFEDSEGRICVMNAVGITVSELLAPTILEDGYVERNTVLRTAAFAAIKERTVDLVMWNYASSDDEVFDTLQQVAKQLRATA